MRVSGVERWKAGHEGISLRPRCVGGRGPVHPFPLDSICEMNLIGLRHRPNNKRMFI